MARFIAKMFFSLLSFKGTFQVWEILLQNGGSNILALFSSTSICQAQTQPEQDVPQTQLATNLKQLVS